MSMSDQRGIFIDFKKRPLSLSDVLDQIGDHKHGAQAFFCGTVRNHHSGKTVQALSYDLFPELARSVLTEICEEAKTKWGEFLKIAVLHSYGKLKVGEISVVIGVSSPHRDESFQACRYVIEQLKVRAPIWKKEHYEDGKTEWVKGHALCSHENL